MLTGFLLSWFHGFMVLCTPSLDIKMAIGFVVLWFHGLFLHALHFWTARCWNQETYHHLAVQRWIARNPETKKHVNILLFRDGVHETMKPRNHETYRHLAVQRCSAQNHETKKPVQRWSAWRNKPWNYETMKPINISMSRDGVHKTIKPQNHETYRHLAV